MNEWKQRPGYQEFTAKECLVTLEPRPPYCDRGNYIAKVFPDSDFAREVDWQDGWPRYYFDEERAKAEIMAWLVKRKQI